MEAHQRNLAELFGSAIRYEMPEAQREYVWDFKGRWEPLWDDVKAIAEAHIRRPQDAVTHFLGPLAVQEVAKEGQVAGDVVTKSVIDGQQRLTTLQLLIHAAQVVVGEHKQVRTAEALRRFVVNDESSWPNGSDDYRYKIWSKASENNRTAFMRAIDEKDSEVSSWGIDDDSQIINAYRFFARRIDGWINEKAEGNSTEERKHCDALRHALLGLLIVIVIDVGKNDDARLIYETLNARGTSLLQSELIKNRIMDTNIVGNERWPFDDNWWNEIPEDEQQRRNRADVLLRHWLVIRRKEFVHPMDVFDAYKKYEDTVSVPNYTKRHILQDIQEISKIYRSFLNPARNDSGLIAISSDDQKAKHLLNISSTDVIPLFLWLRAATNDGTDRQWFKGWLALTSFLARRRMCGQDTTGTKFREIVGRLLRAVQSDVRNVADPSDRLVGHLKDLVKIGTSMWPDDDLLRRSFHERDIYNDPGREVTRDILMMLEEGIPHYQTLADKGQVQSVIPAYGVSISSEYSRNVPVSIRSIEHIMPRAWREHWRTSLDEKLDDEIRRDKRVHTIGNLTLVTPGLNGRLGNNDWRSKKELLSADIESNALLMNKQLINQTSHQWDVEEIANRASYLFEVACIIWPGPNHIAWQ